MSVFTSRPRTACGAFVAGALCAASLAVAQDPPTDDASVLVTASRAQESLRDTLWSSTVLTREDIEARQPSSVMDLLSGIAGIEIGNNGGLGKLSSIFIRGAESDHTLLLVDGVRVASATAGTAAIEFIPVSQIERVEIVRGPRSTLYGTDAVGGVVQIFTRRAAQDGLSIGAEAGGGSHDMRRFGATVQARSERAWVSLGAESFDTDGYNSCASAAAMLFAACFVDEPDADGYRSNSGSLAAGYAFNDAWKAELRTLIADGRAEYDGSAFGGNETEFSQRVFSLSLDGALGDNWHTRLSLGRSQDHLDNFYHQSTGTTPVNFFETDRDTAGIQIDGALTEAVRLVAGIDHQRDAVESDVTGFVSVGYAEDSRSTTGAFAELHGQFGGWSALAGARYEDNEQFGDHVTANAGVGRALTERLRLTATWGTAFHAPTFNELYYPDFGNPDLEPEESSSFEVGLSGRSASAPVDWSLNVFQTDIDDLVGYDSLFNLVNIDETRIRGAELRGNWRGEKWRLGGQITRLDPVNLSGSDLTVPQRTLLLPRRAKEGAALELQRSWSSLSIGTVVHYQGARFDNVANTRRLGGYVTVDLAATQQIGSAFELQARVANVFDRDYQTAAFYLQDGVNYEVTLRYRFAGGR